STAAVIGGILAQEAVRYLCGWRIHSGEATVYNGLALTMHRAVLSRNPDCPYHLPYQNVVELDCTSSTITGHELLSLAAADLGSPIILGLGRDFLLGFFCPSCKRYEEINVLLGKVEETRAICPHCGTAREAKILSQLDGSECAAGRTLQ